MRHVPAIIIILTITLMTLPGPAHAAVSDQIPMGSSTARDSVKQLEPELDVKVASFDGFSEALRYLRLHNVVPELPKRYDIEQSEIFEWPILELRDAEPLAK